MDFTKNTRVVIGSDHGGFEIKEVVKDYLQRLGYCVVDLGCHSPDPVDYPDIAFLVASTIATNDDTAGIMVDG
ncbi:MAG: RpiB/LacA/LacB family sugar-phosphate isomerase, partial [Methanopyri archaeon]|nr:RpiB/LacA/LacB family sugar-phosphate isomerase [Methanopyri archaeon]